jgi:CDP-diacylglycerol--glycerol-3-phosphate 3-phosphatidyltransferase
VTDFGKFIDPLADKFMIFGACITFLVIDPHTAPTFLWISAIIMLRELAVTSMRLVVANTSGIVISASFFGKCKTVVQIVAVLVMFLEPVLGWFSALIGIDFLTTIFSRAILSYIAMVIMGIVTLASGIDYMRAYFPYINTNK